MNPKSRACTLNVGAIDMAAAPACPSRERLAKSFARLQNIQRLRDLLGDPLFEKVSEGQLVWRELLELELQAVDDKIG